MDFKEQLLTLAERVSKLKEQVKTEEAVKTSFVLPFLQALGYDVFNPAEVVPECDCDHGTKKGEKIDYMVKLDGEPIMLVECKHWAAPLNKFQAQLFRYYAVSKAKLGVLTDGINYKFYADLDAQNKMDDRPFFEIDMLDLKDSHIEKLKQFRREQYDAFMILHSAQEMKYVNAFRQLIESEIDSPTDAFVKFLTKEVYSGMVTKNVIEDFRPMIQRAFAQYLTDAVNDRLKQALTPDIPSVDMEQPTEERKDRVIETTDEELMGMMIVRAILCGTVDLDRVVERDAQSYFAILFDDNNRKPICRLHFNGVKKYIETFDEQKNGTKHPVEAMSDIYKVAQELKTIVEFYMK